MEKERVPHIIAFHTGSQAASCLFNLGPNLVEPSNLFSTKTLKVTHLKSKAGCITFQSGHPDMDSITGPSQFVLSIAPLLIHPACAHPCSNDNTL